MPPRSAGSTWRRSSPSSPTASAPATRAWSGRWASVLVRAVTVTAHCYRPPVFQQLTHKLWQQRVSPWYYGQAGRCFCLCDCTLALSREREWGSRSSWCSWSEAFWREILPQSRRREACRLTGVSVFLFFHVKVKAVCPQYKWWGTLIIIFQKTAFELFQHLLSFLSVQSTAHYLCHYAFILLLAPFFKRWCPIHVPWKGQGFHYAYGFH